MRATLNILGSVLLAMAALACVQPAFAQESAASAVEAARSAIERARQAGGEREGGDDLAAARSWYSQAEKALDSATSILGRVATAATRRERDEEIVYLARMARVKAETAEAKARRVATRLELAEAQKLLAGFQGALAIAREREATDAKAKAAQATTDTDRRQLEEAQRKLAEAERQRADTDRQRAAEQAAMQEKLAALEKDRAAQALQTQAMERERAVLAAAGKIPQTTSRVSGRRVVISMTVANLFTPANEISPAGRKVLDGVGDFLKETAVAKVLVRSYTDDRGSSATNQALSVKRADAVREYLVGAKGIPADRVSSEGLGEADPVATNANDAGRALNRRVDISVPLSE